MISKSFRVRAVVRVILIGLAMAALVFSIYQETWYVATGVSAIVTILLIVELFFFIDRSNREFSNLLQALKHQDFSQAYSGKYREKSFLKMEETFREVIKTYRDNRIEKEIHYQYLQFIINHINLAIVCYKEDGNIELFNPAASKLLGIGHAGNIQLFKKLDEKLYKLILKLGSGQKELIKLMINGELMDLSIHATEFKLQGIHFKLISFQNIKSELEEQELESWQKLIRVLTHEIMNSVTPVSSLSTAINEMLQDDKGNRISLSNIEKEDADDMYDSLKTIEERSKSLLNFVSSYKNLTRLPHPHFQHIHIKDIFEHVKVLMNKEMEKNNIRFDVNIGAKGMEIYADKDMIQQVLINLIVNAKDALEKRENKKIELISIRNKEKILIQVKDNGPGIDEENIDKVFVPFFTTKKKGSGIGLSLARQIIRLHKGSIFFQTEKGQGTTFTLEF